MLLGLIIFENLKLPFNLKKKLLSFRAKGSFTKRFNFQFDSVFNDFLPRFPLQDRPNLYTLSSQLKFSFFYIILTKITCQASHQLNQF